jgi:hypothetical protein
MLCVPHGVGVYVVCPPAASALEHGVGDMQDVIAMYLQLPFLLPLQGQVDPDVERVP